MASPGPLNGLAVTVYYLAIAGLFLYGMNCYVLMYLQRRHRRAMLRRDEAVWRDAVARRALLPVVTVQLPVYNERYVVERLLAAVTRLDYPRDRLEIQVLDDSTDATTDLLRRLVAAYRREGLDVTLLHRHDRTGFKAGALEAGLAAARGELIAIFDADFVPPPDFLQRTVPFFFEDPRLGMVQTRWGHLNADYSILTRAQALVMDGHFWVEQAARSWSGLFLSFNGSAGVWRRSAIAAAGGWQWDTLTEDLDLSYRAQLAGWRMKFLPQVVCPAELPVQLSALKSQQQRWANGTIRTALKLAPRVVRARLPLAVKYQALLHLSVYMVYPLMLVVALLSPLLPWLGGSSPAGERPLLVNLLFSAATFGSVGLFLQAQRGLHADWRRRMLFLPSLVIFSTGMALNNTKAIIEVFLKLDRSWVRTPKFRIEKHSDTWIGKRYRVPFGWVTLMEALVAVYFGWVIALAVRRGDPLVDPFLVLYLAGFAIVSLLSIWEALGAPLREPVRSLVRSKRRATAALLIALLAPAAASAAPGPSGDLERLVDTGRRWWTESPDPGDPVACATCHYDPSQTRGWASSFPKVQPMPPPDARVMTLLQANAEAVRRHYGLEDVLPASIAITAFLVAQGAGVPISPGVSAGQPVFESRLTALAASVERGRRLFAERCRACHASTVPPSVARFPRVVAGRAEALEGFLEGHHPRGRRLVWDGPEMADLCAYLVSRSKESR